MSKRNLLVIAILSLVALAGGCRYDMQDQPRLKYYKQSDFFADKRGSRDQVENTIARGHLYDNKAFYTGKIDNPNPNAPAATSTDANGNTVVTSFPNDIDAFPVPVTKELIDRGQERFNIYCIVCHGPLGRGDGMVVRRGFPNPPTYHDDRLRNAPVGHFFDVITNGWGKMNSYAFQVPPADRWAIIAYIRALQATDDPNQTLKMNSSTTTTNSNNAAPAAKPASNTIGGKR
ncbi:MAG TPA: cytochrome c [Pyrinomonadaceae bacterium]|jgi:mono/diheme cytochrome c family protein